MSRAIIPGSKGKRGCLSGSLVLPVARGGTMPDPEGVPGLACPAHSPWLQTACDKRGASGLC